MLPNVENIFFHTSFSVTFINMGMVYKVNLMKDEGTNPSGLLWESC